MSDETLLSDWVGYTKALETALHGIILGLERPIRLMLAAVFARGHVMLEGDVGVGKTTLLRAVARGLGGAFERIEGTIDLMPTDLIYYSHVDQDGRPRIDPGCLLKHGEELSIFFFNEINRARPQVHSLLLRIMAERSVTAFNREYQFPHLLVFADRNRLEKEETFEIPSAARDRFLMELTIEIPEDPAIQRSLMVDPRFHDVETLIEAIPPAIVPFRQLCEVAALIQRTIHVSPDLERYALELWRATRNPGAYGIRLEGVEVDRLMLAGASPRGMSMLLRAARVMAWLSNRSMVVPEDIQEVFIETVAHRLCFRPIYEIRRSQLARELLSKIIHAIAAP